MLKYSHNKVVTFEEAALATKIAFADVIYQFIQ